MALNQQSIIRTVTCEKRAETEQFGTRIFLIQSVPGVKVTTLGLIPELILSQKCHIHTCPIRNGSYKFTVQHSNKLFEVSSICWDTFSDSCDQRTSKPYEAMQFSGHTSQKSYPNRWRTFRITCLNVER
jgi:hypothetical protein